MLYTIKILYGYPTGFNITSAFRDHLAHINLYKFNSIYIPLGTTTRFSIFTVVQHRTKISHPPHNNFIGTFATQVCTQTISNLHTALPSLHANLQTPVASLASFGLEIVLHAQVCMQFPFQCAELRLKKKRAEPEMIQPDRKCGKMFSSVQIPVPHGAPIQHSVTQHGTNCAWNIRTLSLQTCTCHLYVYILNLPAKVNTMSRRSFKISHAAGQAKKTRAYVCKLPHP